MQMIDLTDAPPLQILYVFYDAVSDADGRHHACATHDDLRAVTRCITTVDQLTSGQQLDTMAY